MTNVLGTELVPCSFEPMTGFFRDGCCNTGPEDRGMHLVCAEMNEQYLRFSKATGNDLSTPRPEYGFAGLEPGDRWCICVERWVEAYEAGVAPRIVLASTHLSTLEFVTLDELKKFSLD